MICYSRSMRSCRLLVEAIALTLAHNSVGSRAKSKESKIDDPNKRR